jgi:uroporphyrinogen decarboxylase
MPSIMASDTQPKTPLIVSSLRREKTDRTPIWLMRQAGRYLPEYRALRAKAGGFLAMAYDPELASEITMQPVRRFAVDGAILFSDILVIPHALGQDLRFETGEGPRLGELNLEKLNVYDIDQTLAPVYETLKQTRTKLDSEGFAQTALIGFCGSPWTVACYMLEGRGATGFPAAKKYAQDNKAGFAALLDILVEASIHYLIRQAEAGAQVLQLFESWAGIVDEANFDAHVIKPTQTIIRALKQKFPHIPVIGFPRGVSPALLSRYVAQTGIDGLGCDQSHSPSALKTLQNSVCIQGNLDNELLLAGGAAMEDAARRLLDTLGEGAFIFNLGHGVIKETPPEHVAALVKLVQEYRL